MAVRSLSETLRAIDAEHDVNLEVEIERAQELEGTEKQYFDDMQDTTLYDQVSDLTEQVERLTTRREALLRIIGEHVEALSAAKRRIAELERAGVV